MRAHLNVNDILLQQCREDGTGNTVVLHEELKHNVVDGVCYGYHFVML